MNRRLNLANVSLLSINHILDLHLYLISSITIRVVRLAMILYFVVEMLDYEGDIVVGKVVKLCSCPKR